MTTVSGFIPVISVAHRGSNFDRCSSSLNQQRTCTDCLLVNLRPMFDLCQHLILVTCLLAYWDVSMLKSTEATSLLKFAGGVASP